MLMVASIKFTLLACEHGGVWSAGKSTGPDDGAGGKVVTVITQKMDFHPKSHDAVINKNVNSRSSY